MKSKNITKTIFAVLAALVLFTGCTGSQETETTVDDVVKVKVSPVVSKVITREITIPTTLIPFKEMDIASSLSARIEEINVEIGSKVNEGDLLVKLDESNFNQALFQNSNYKVDFERMKELNEIGSITPQQFDQSELQLDLSESQISTLERNTYMTAPFSGVISEKNFEEGALYSAIGSAIVKLVQINPLKAVVDFSESYFPQIHKGMELTFTSDIYPDQEFKGEIYRIYPIIDSNSHTFSVEITIDNAEELLRPGMFSKVTTYLQDEEVIVCPSNAILKLQGSNERYAFIDVNGKAKRVTVELGQMLDGEVEVISGDLKAGDKLVVTGQDNLIDGTTITVAND